MNPYILFLAAFALWYVPGALALTKINYSFKNIELVKIQSTYIDLGVKMIVDNKTNKSLDIKSVSLWIYLDAVFITEMLVKDIYLSAKSTQTIGAIFRIDKNKVPNTLWSSFINKSFKNSTITFKGLVRSDGRPYPFIVEMTVKDLIEYTIN